MTSARKLPSSRTRALNGDAARSFLGSAARRYASALDGERRRRRGALVDPVRLRARRTRRRPPPSTPCRAPRQEQHDGESCGSVDGARAGAVASTELRTVGEEERHIGAERRGELVQLPGVERLVELRVREPSAVAASELPPPRPAATGICFSMRGAPAVRRVERRERAPHDRVAREPVDGGAVAGSSGGGREPDALVNGHELVLAVGARRANDEREVDLRRRRARSRPRAPSGAPRIGRRKLLGPHVAPRPTGQRLDSRLARRDPSERERVRECLAPVRERSLDDALDLRRGPGAIRRNATSAESTFGRGRKTSRETGWRPVRSAASWTSTETAPYAFVDGPRRTGPRPRAAPSRTTSRSAPASRLSATSGVAMLYGRFATSFHGAVRALRGRAGPRRPSAPRRRGIPAS